YARRPEQRANDLSLKRKINRRHRHLAHGALDGWPTVSVHVGLEGADRFYRARRLTSIRETAREDLRVLEGRVRSMRTKWRHGVNRVADERHPRRRRSLDRRCGPNRHQHGLGRIRAPNQLLKIVVESIDRLARHFNKRGRIVLAVPGAFRLTNGNGPHEVVLRWPVAACDPKSLRGDRWRLAEAHRRPEKDATAGSHRQDAGGRQDWAEHRESHLGQSCAAENPDYSCVSRRCGGQAKTANA